MKTDYLAVLVAAFGLALTACGGGGGGGENSDTPPPVVRKSQWELPTHLGSLPNSGARFFRLANVDSPHPVVTWSDAGQQVGLAERIGNSGWTQPEIPFPGNDIRDLTPVVDTAGNLTLLGLHVKITPSGFEAQMQANTRKGSNWGPLTDLGEPFSSSFLYQPEDYAPIVKLAGTAQIFVFWRQPSSAGNQLQVARYASGKWTVTTLANGPYSNLLLAANADGSAYAGWLSNSAFYLARFDDGKWEAAKELNIALAGNFDGYYALLSRGTTKAYIISPSFGNLHFYQYENDVLSDSVINPERFDAEFIRADMANDGSIVAGWSDSNYMHSSARVFNGSQWGPIYKQSSTHAGTYGIAGAQIVSMNKAVIAYFRDVDGSEIHTVDWLDGAWHTDQIITSAPNSSGAFIDIALSRTSSGQWIAGWDAMQNSLESFNVSVGAQAPN